MCVCYDVSHPRLLAGRVGLGVTEDEADVLAEVDGRLVLPVGECALHGAEVHGGLHDLQVVLQGLQPQQRHRYFTMLVSQRTLQSHWRRLHMYFMKELVGGGLGILLKDAYRSKCWHTAHAHGSLQIEVATTLSCTPPQKTAEHYN